LVETVTGKLLGYGTIELEAPGDHPGVRRLQRIADPQSFYQELRRVIFADDVMPDPDFEPGNMITAPLPAIRHEQHRERRERFGWPRD
jgi:hypothetical protein